MVRPPAALMAAFARWGLPPDWMESGAAVRSISIDRPSLETVFLELTGRSLRD